MRFGIVGATVLFACTSTLPVFTPPPGTAVAACAPTIARMVPPREVMEFMLAGTRPAPGYSPPPNPTIEVTPELWASSKNWFGDGVLWIQLPDDGVTRGLSERIPVYRMTSGVVTIEARRLDGSGTASPAVPSGYGDRGFQASGIDFSSAGCWGVVYSMADHRLQSVLKVEGRQP